MTYDCENLLVNIEVLKDDSEYIHILCVLSELMYQIKDKHLTSAQYTNEFVYDRMRVRVIIDKEATYA